MSENKPVNYEVLCMNGCAYTVSASRQYICEGVLVFVGEDSKELIKFPLGNVVYWKEIR
jgi:hypothetical protein